MKFNPKEIIEELKLNKQLFVSESHFVTSFILQSKASFKNLTFITEYPYNDGLSQPQRYDLVVFDNETKEYSVLEFKWLSSKIQIEIPGNPSFMIKNRSNVRQNKLFDCYDDIASLEKTNFINNYKNYQNYFILLTNHRDVINSSFEKCCLNDGGTIKAGEYIHPKKGKIIIKNDYFVKYEQFDSNNYYYVIVNIKNNS